MKRLGLRLAPAAMAAVLASASAGALIWTGPAAAAETITVCASGCQYTTIQEAINHASNPATIQIGAGTYRGFGWGRRLGITLEGTGAGKTIISGGNFEDVAIIGREASVAINGVTITDGNSTLLGSGGFGGGIVNLGRLTLSNSTVSGNHALLGGGIANEGPLTLNNSTISGNTATFGGGIYNARVEGGQVTLNNSTVSGNTAGSGGGIFNESGLEGTEGMTLKNSTVNGNTAEADGGGILNSGRLTLENSFVTGNTVSLEGGGIFNLAGAVTTLKNSKVRLNSPDNCFGTIC